MIEAFRYAVKFYIQAPVQPDTKEFIPVFHRWIQQHTLNELLIDVADYSHVHHGPGVMLICHEAHYAIDQEGGRPGLLYSRKQLPANQDHQPLLHDAFRKALTACLALEQESSLLGRIKFSCNEVLLTIHDRLLAPNTPETWQSVAPTLESFLIKLYGGNVATMQHIVDPKACFRVLVQADVAHDVATLLARLDAETDQPTPAT